MDLEPLRDARAAGGAFVATGPAPSFRLSARRAPLPGGWVLLSLVAEPCEDVTEVRLRADGDPRESWYTLPLPPRAGRRRFLVRIPRRPAALHLDLLVRPGRLRIEDVRVDEISRAAALARLLRRIGGHLLSSPARLPPLLGEVLRAGRAEGLEGVKDLLAGLAFEARRSAEFEPDYRRWIEANDRIGPAEIEAIRGRIEVLAERPLFSILVPSDDAGPAVESLRAQIYTRWEVLHGADALRRATGPFVALIDPDDALAPHALYLVAEEIARRPDAEVVYTDEDRIDAAGRRLDPHFKPDFDPDLPIGRLAVHRTETARGAGGIDPDIAHRLFDGGTPADRIRHVPHVLYHRRAPAACAPAGRPVLPDPPPPVSVVVPTRDRVDLLRPCLEGVLARSTYPRIEVVVVDNGSREEETLAYLRALEEKARARVIRDERPFNYAALNNMGVRAARGDVVVLLNDDVEVVTPGWLEEMVGHALRPGVGAVGAMLYYPDGAVQHAGIILGLLGMAGHALAGVPREEALRLPYGRATLVRSCAAVTGACLAVRRSLYLEAGGMDEAAFPVGFNDVDLCLRLAEAGHRTVWTPHAELIHRESASRSPLERTVAGADRARREAEVFRARWARRIAADPAYNPNLSLWDVRFRPATRSRAPRPWRGVQDGQSGMVVDMLEG